MSRLPTATTAPTADSRLASLEALYETHHRQAFGLACRLLGNREDAEDALQEVFLSAWRALGTYDPGRGSTRTWLLAIVRHRCADVLRARVHQRYSSLDAADSVVDPRPADENNQSTSRAVVLDALFELPTPQQEVIQLAYYAGLSHTEIAARMGIPQGTVKSRLRLGFERLKQALAAPELETAPA